MIERQDVLRQEKIEEKNHYPIKFKYSPNEIRYHLFKQNPDFFNFSLIPVKIAPILPELEQTFTHGERGRNGSQSVLVVRKRPPVFLFLLWVYSVPEPNRTKEVKGE